MFRFGMKERDRPAQWERVKIRVQTDRHSAEKRTGLFVFNVGPTKEDIFLTPSIGLYFSHQHAYIDGSRAVVVWILAKVLN